MTEIQIRKSLLILRSKPNTTSGAETFLKNREWEIYSTTNMKEFLTYIIQKKPSFVMISVEHTHKKIKVMPSIILQSFPVCVITFAENSSSASFRKLQEVSCDYKVNPPATGPAIERAVNKYLKDLEKKEKEPTKNGADLNADGKTGPDTVEIKGGVTSGALSAFQGGMSNGTNSGANGAMTSGISGGVGETSWGQGSSLLSQLMDNEDSSSSESEKLSSVSSISGVSGIGSGSATTGGGYWAPDEAGKKNNSHKDPEPVTYREDDFAGGFIPTSDGQPSPKNSSDPVFGDPMSSRGPSNGGDSISLNLQRTEKNSGFLGQNKPTENQISKEQAGQGESFFNATLGKQKKINPNEKVETQLGRNTFSDLDSIMVKGAKHALIESVKINDGIIDQELEGASQVACIIVESERFNGYLIAAMGKNRKMDGKFIKTIQEKLFKFLKDNGENIVEKENMQLKIKKVEFQDWAVEYADFLKKSVHNGEEIAMAFFPVNQVKPEVGESASTTMAAVKLKDLEPDKPVDFNLYVYLPANKKYILYTPKGAKFYGNQKSRLSEKGVTEVHMLKSEVNDLTKYKAQNYLNNLIENYELKKKLTKVS